jgi:hypothetical protein
VLIATFFTWKIMSLTDEDLKERWTSTHAIAKEECWSLDDLKEISVRGGELWRYATSKGVPDGIARSLHSNLKAYKQWYRQRFPIGVVADPSTITGPV